MSNSSSENEVPTRSTTNEPTFLETCDLDADYKALEEHLVSNPVQQSDLDRCLLRGLRIVQRVERELSHVAPSLTLLLQSGAKWNKHSVLARQSTPVHIICYSPGDHHELLDLIIKSSQRTIINRRDNNSHTALMYAVKSANINCLKYLIANEADITIGHEGCRGSVGAAIQPLTPITAAIWMLSNNSEYSYDIKSDILDVLLDTTVKKNEDHFKSCPDYIVCARHFGNVTCMITLITLGAPLNIIAYDDDYVWGLVASMGNVELLMCMFNHGIDKDATDHNGLSMLGFVVGSGNIDAVRYLLDLGVTIPTFTLKVPETQCEQCKENRLIIDVEQMDQNPCMRAIRSNKLDMVKLFVQYGSEDYKSFCALKHAVRHSNVDVISYLLNKYTYSLNTEYIIKLFTGRICTLLTDPFTQKTEQITKLLLDHGADPVKPMCRAGIYSAFMTTVIYGTLEIIAQYIRNGVDVSFKSRTHKQGIISPFDVSVLRDRYNVSVMLLISGCSRGTFSNLNLKAKPELEKLMKKWNVYDDNVTTLKQRCRSVILNHLSPGADLKIKKLPLPTCVIKFLRIPELDNIVYEYNRSENNEY